jgi:hypothetical protein
MTQSPLALLRIPSMSKHGGHMSSRCNILWVAPWGLASWLLVEVAVFIPLFLLGLALLPVLLKWAPIVHTESRVNAGQQIEMFRWRWAQTIWGNWEDGLLPAWWAQQGGSRYSWFIRNPVCNMRFWPIVSTMPSTGVRWCGNVSAIPPDGSPGWFVAWQGGYVGIRWQCKSWGIWVGWKLNPADRNGCDDYRRFGIGTACQIMRF